MRLGNKLNVIVLGVSLALAGCNLQDGEGRTVHTFGGQNEPKALTIIGYNYTDREIDDFRVNERGGGNIHVSSPNGGGGGSVCCARYTSGTEQASFHIRWQSGACRFGHMRTRDGSELFQLHSFYKEASVVAELTTVKDPEYVEVHFFPDGSVKVRITDVMSSPIIALPEEREQTQLYPKCPGDVKPAYASEP